MEREEAEASEGGAEHGEDAESCERESSEREVEHGEKKRKKQKVTDEEV